MSRYRKIEVRTWSDEKFRALSGIPPSGQGLWFFLLTGPHTTAIPGLFRVGRAAMAEELDWEQEDFDKAFREVSELGMAKADFKAKLVWLPKAVQHNKPESPNVVRSWRVEMDLLPECELKREAIAGIRAALGAMGAPYVEAFDEILQTRKNAEEKASPKPSAKPSAKAMANQEQEQEQEQDKEEAKASLSASAKPTDDETDDGVPPCPFDKLIDSYKKHLPELPDVRRSLFAGGKNGKAMRSRWRWVLTAKHERGPRIGERLAESAQDGIAWFDRYFAFVADSDFLTGKSGAFTGCDLGWLVNASNFEKVLSGKYHAEKREAANA